MRYEQRKRKESVMITFDEFNMVNNNNNNDKIVGDLLDKI